MHTAGGHTQRDGHIEAPGSKERQSQNNLQRLEYKKDSSLTEQRAAQVSVLRVSKIPAARYCPHSPAEPPKSARRISGHVCPWIGRASRSPGGLGRSSL